MISRLNPIPFLKLQNDCCLPECMYVEPMCVYIAQCMCLSFLQTMDILVAAKGGSLHGVCYALEAGVPVDTTDEV